MYQRRATAARRSSSGVDVLRLLDRIVFFVLSVVGVLGALGLVLGAVLLLGSMVAGTASAASIAVCNGTMNNLISSGNYTARCNQAWLNDDSSYFYIEQLPFLFSRSGDHQNRIGALEARVTDLEAAAPPEVETMTYHVCTTVDVNNACIEWQTVTYPAIDFDFSQLDPALIAGAFSAGFLIVLTMWGIGRGVRVLLSMIR